MDCSCNYCYHNVCFHPLRGDESGLGVPCDGCHLEDLPDVVTAPTITVPDDIRTIGELSDSDS